MANRGSTVVPCVSYRDANAMMDWLCNVIGFTKHAVYPDDKGGVAHAELVLGGGMLMVSTAPGPDAEYAWAKLMRHPDAVGFETQSPSLYVEDPDAVYARVKASGATIVMDIEDKHYGGRGFGCKDPEGHLWSIGNYDPWASQPGK